ncbi:hypothetical protein PI125_g7805 [Phytophthora idaei]|nr:hypothetical protein PI125_g7805 [Phytophthora idaei]
MCHCVSSLENPAAATDLLTTESGTASHALRTHDATRSTEGGRGFPPRVYYTSSESFQVLMNSDNLALNEL